MESIFIFISFLILLLSINKKAGKLLLFIVFVILFILLGFRSINVGTDTINYLEIFERINYYDNKEIEIGWKILNTSIFNIGIGYQGFIVLIAFITLLPVYITVKKHSVNPMFSIFFYYTLYFYFNAFNISRQALAVVIILAAMPLLLKDKKTIYILFVLLASSFHTTALVALPLVVINKMPNYTLIYFLGVTLSLFIGIKGFTLLYSLAPETDYAHYAEAVDTSNLKAGMSFLLALNIFFFFVLFFIRERSTYFNLFFVYVMVTNITSKVPYGYRLVMYFSIAQVLFLPFFIRHNKFKGNWNIISIIAVILYSYLLFFRSYGTGEIFPYDNILFQQ